MKKRSINSVRLAAVILLMLPVMLFKPAEADAGTLIPENLRMSVNGGDTGTVRAINVSYDNNAYISLRDTAVLLAGTPGAFSVEISDGSVSITKGESYSDEYSHSGYEPDDLAQYPGNEPVVSPLKVNEEERRYFTLIKNMGDYHDCFMCIADLAMILDVDLEMDDSVITVDTSSRFDINPARLEEYGFFDGANTVVVGDAATGEVFYGFNMEEPQPIASTTKLMTYLITMDAVKSGKISLEDTVTVSSAAAKLSASQDGSVALKEGWEIPVSELIIGALLPSSNECALLLAEHVGGSEEAFVDMMNEKAQELSLTSASFHNPNGLPIYTDTAIAAKTQNKMSGYDMFRLCSHIVTTYPEIKEITSQKKLPVPTLGLDLKNTNGLLYNIPEVNGLKTGTTDRSGACLVTSLSVLGDGGMHDIIVVELGAENSIARLRISELMARYGMNVIKGSAAKIGSTLNNTEKAEEPKVTAERIIKIVVDHALKKKQQR